ncbi:MAG TPA: hypothetical protein VFG73_02465 [Rhodanobacteraceae bacterium]|nr:hypothetical protein [Rhodanobacteraceae bacterium]
MATVYPKTLFTLRRAVRMAGATADPARCAEAERSALCWVRLGHRGAYSRALHVLRHGTRDMR